MRKIIVNTHDEGCLLDAEQVATIGFFDGVHRGHRFLISQLQPKAGEESLVLTFDRHPLAVLRPELHPRVLSSLDVKLLLLSYTGVDNVAVLRFDADMASMSAYEFMGRILRERLNVRRLILGYDNRFGKRQHDRTETFEDYVEYGRTVGIDVRRAEEWTNHGEKVSSSAVRHYLEEGQLELATAALGYEYTLVGTVVRGYQEGRKLGFPTANIDLLEEGQLVPAPGVYAVKVRLKNAMTWHWGMMNIGMRPTFNGTTQTLEINILNFAGNLYGEIMLVKLMKRIRQECFFDSHEALARQLEQDRVAVEELKKLSGS